MKTLKILGALALLIVLLAGNRFEIKTSNNHTLWMVNRLTGDAYFCTSSGCKPIFFGGRL